MKVVFHIDFDSTPVLEILLGNIKNLLKERDAEVAVVANGYAVKLFTKANLSKYEPEIRKLLESGVEFYVCNNALKNLVGVQPSEISGLCKIIPAGVVKLIELQNMGFAYIKP
jgi:hypothetical protein